ncbi:hypothetical protein WKI68_05480 [Streptomyces sp. MS1.HAVA.3]|uniref:Uncharacterized protein n=1 Tax=Streptomyces caledonius TaxID=3134107 RepID=A0ABU8U1H5_9ACTN
MTPAFRISCQQAALVKWNKALIVVTTAGRLGGQLRLQLADRPIGQLLLPAQPRPYDPPAFQAGFQGSAVEEYDPHIEKNNFSVMPVPGPENGAAGNLLRGFHNANRVIDGLEDGFIIKIS